DPCFVFVLVLRSPFGFLIEFVVKLKRSKMEMKTMGAALLGVATQELVALTMLRIAVLYFWKFNERPISIQSPKNNALCLQERYTGRTLLYPSRAVPTFVSTSWRHPWDGVLKVILRRASVMANTTPLVTTVTKPTINPVEANFAPRVNIQEFCEEHYEDILPIIMEKVRHDRRKDVHTRLDFGEGPRERVREDSYSNTRARASEPPGRVKVQDRLKYETGHMKGAPECMRISGFMHGVNNPELTKLLNEHVPKTMEEMMITTTAFIRGEAAAASKKKGHASWKPQDQSKRHSSDKRPDFRGHPRGKGGLTDLLLLP
nr:reverse transcriptase domain-containing protein [Tanacetum cinerariifolium]